MTLGESGLPARWPTRLVILLLVLCGLYGSYRAVHLAIINDECGTIQVSKYGYKTLLTGRFREGTSVHLLSTLLAKPCVEFLPINEITAARIPSLFGLGLYLWGVWRIGKMFPNGIPRVLITVAFLSNALLLEHFGIARGGGLALGFTMLSLSCFPSTVGLWTAAMTTLAHPSFVWFFFGVFGLTMFLKRREKRMWIHAILVLTLLALYGISRMEEFRRQPSHGASIWWIPESVLGIGGADHYSRYVIYLAPITVLGLGLGAVRVRQKWMRLSSWCAIIAISISGLRGINLSFCQQGRECADVPSALLALQEVHRQTGQDVMVAFSPGKWTLWYYAEHLLGLHLEPSETDISYLRTYGWLTVYEWKVSQTYFSLPPDNPLLPGTTHLLLNLLSRDDQRLLATPLPGGLAQMHIYPASGTTLEMLIVPQHQGAVTPPNGQKYVGEFKHGVANGQGMYTWPDGRKYVGEIRDGKPNGQGNGTSPDGRTYVGEFKDGVPNGPGTGTWPDGRKYVGEFKDGKPNGQGNGTSPDGRRYVGEFRQGQIDGAGKMIYPDGRVEDGLWKQGQFTGAAAH